MQVSYQTALAAVCVEGILFIILAVTGLRLRLIRLVPKSIMLATSAGRRPVGLPPLAQRLSCVPPLNQPRSRSVAVTRV